MTDKKKMSVEEVLAACRRDDGSGAAADTPADDTRSGVADESVTPPAAREPTQREGTSEESTDEESTDSAAATPPRPAASTADVSKMSVADMLAAARAEKSKPAAESKPAAAAPEKKTTEKKTTEKKTTEKKTTEKKTTEKKTTEKTPAAAAKPAAAGAKTGVGAAVPKDTASILAAARKGAKPGPISKAEAAAQEEAASDRKAPEKKKSAAPPMPERPAYARPPAPRPDSAPRRNFMATMAAAFFGSSLAVGFTTLAVTHLLWLLGLARFMFPNVLIEPPTRFKVGFADDLAPGQVETKYKAQFGVWVVRYEFNGQPQIFALQTVCTHLGCTPNWLEGEQKFKCPCHGSGFYKDGVNFEGPAPRPLERFAIRVADDGQLEVDKSRKFQEELGQWEDPSSFVSV